MSFIYFVSLYIHLLAGVVWFGSMIFFSLIMMPVFKRPQFVHLHIQFFQALAPRLKIMGWSCLLISLISGSINLWIRYQVGNLRQILGWPLMIKLCLFLGILGISAAHDFIMGPRAVALMIEDPQSDKAIKYRKRARLLGLANAAFGFLILGLGIFLVKK